MMAVPKLSVTVLLFCIWNLHTPAVLGIKNIEQYIDGSYKRNYIITLYGDFADSIGTTKEDKETFKVDKNIGDFEIKVLNKETHEFEIKIEVLAGDKKTTEIKTHKLTPGSPGELSWWDGRLFSVNNLEKFETGDDKKFLTTGMNLTIGGVDSNMGIVIGSGQASMTFQNFNRKNIFVVNFIIKK